MSTLYQRPWIYCAGKISPCDWRNEIFNTRCIDGRDDRGWSHYEGSQARFLGLGDGGNHPTFRYAGPFFIGCDHTCGHGAATHGCAAISPHDSAVFNGESDGGCITAPADRQDVLRASLAGIQAADLVFVWIDADFATAYGTIAEIGYARALNKPVYAARALGAAAHDILDLWFPLTMVTNIGCFVAPEAALRRAARRFGVVMP